MFNENGCTLKCVRAGPEPGVPDVFPQSRHKRHLQDFCHSLTFFREADRQEEDASYFISSQGAIVLTPGLRLRRHGESDACQCNVPPSQSGPRVHAWMRSTITPTGWESWCVDGLPPSRMGGDDPARRAQLRQRHSHGVQGHGAILPQITLPHRGSVSDAN